MLRPCHGDGDGGLTETEFLCGSGAVLYLFADEGAGQGNNGPEENATAQDDLSVEAVAQVAENGRSHHEAADEN